MEVILLQLFNGVSISSILLLISLGLSITFGLMKVINMAHGEFIMIGAYTAYVSQNIFQIDIPRICSITIIVFAIPIAFIVAFCYWLIC